VCVCVCVQLEKKLKNERRRADTLERDNEKLKVHACAHTHITRKPFLFHSNTPSPPLFRRGLATDVNN